MAPTAKGPQTTDISHYTNHLAETPLDPFMKGAEWQARGHLRAA